MCPNQKNLSQCSTSPAKVNLKRALIKLRRDELHSKR